MNSSDLSYLVDLYRRRARRYDLYARLYPLIGFRHMRYRSQAIETLHLKPGSAVVDIGCGTGLNFERLQKAVGLGGRVIGVDLSDAMLKQAQRRVWKAGWQNVTLIQASAAEFPFPPNTGGIISTFALTLVPEYSAVIERGAQSLAESARWSVLDFKIPNHWLSHLTPALARLLIVPFGGTMEMGKRHPWESIQRYLDLVFYKELYFGCAYLAVGERKPPGRRTS